MPDYETILNMNPLELIRWLHDEFNVELPTRLISTEDMETASELLLRFSAQYAYLAELLSYAKVAVRVAKREYPKEEWENMVDRKEAIERRLDIAKQQYAAVSRAITVKADVDREMSMSGNTPTADRTTDNENTENVQTERRYNFGPGPNFR